MTGLWKTWITLWCWGVILFGAVLTTASLPATEDMAGLAYSVIGDAQVDAGYFDSPGMRFSVGVMGAVTLGWGFTILFLLPAIHAAGAPAWKGLTAALVIWFLVDGAISVATGFVLNTVSNTALLAAYLIPVLSSGVLKTRV